MTLLLVRHGRTASNVSRALDSRPPGAPLDEVGLAQAAAVGERLSSWPVSAVYASAATRAQQTAAPIAGAHGLPFHVLDGVHEVFCGDLEGRVDEAARALFDETYAAWWSGDFGAHLPGGESAHDLHARYLPAVERITACAAGAVVLVSHGAAIRLAAAALLGEPGVTRYVPNTGLVVLEHGPAGWTLEHWDEAPAVAGDVTAGGPPGS
jgi:broad specificity phosphatase PhoE